eukprot:PITA_32062
MLQKNKSGKMPSLKNMSPSSKMMSGKWFLDLKKKRIDYDDIFVPVARYTTIRSIVALAANQGWTLHQMDMKIAFLHGFLKEEVFVEQPRGFEKHDRETHVCKLKKALYGLKQAPRAWYACIDSFLMKLGFTRSSADPNLYFKIIHGIPLILVLYIDDLFLTGGEPLILQCKRELASEFEMKDVGLMHYFLGLGKAAKPNLANPTEYRQLIGALMFLVNTRPDIHFVVSTLSQNMIDSFHAHWIVAKHVLRYLHGTVNLGLKYTAKNVRLHGHTDVDWAGNSADRKSTFGRCFRLGSAMISWMSKKKKFVALSTTDVEYIAASMASCEAVWLRKIFQELFEQVPDTTVIYCDNRSGICLAENHVFHDKSKHIEIKYHYIQDMVQRGVVRLHHISIDDQIADILTEPLLKGKFFVLESSLDLWT